MHIRLTMTFCLAALAVSGAERPQPGTVFEPRHAENFTIRYTESAKRITVRDPWAGAGDTSFTYVLPYEDQAAPTADGGRIRELNPGRAIVTSTTFLPHFVELGLVDRIVAVANHDHVNSAEIRRAIEDGAIAETGRGPAMNTEVAMALNPDAIFTSAVGEAGRDALPKLRERDLPTVVTASYMEASPLGRAEWIVFIGAFFDREKEAKAIFREIENAYNAIAEKTREIEARPTVFVNVPWGGTWHMPGGDGYKAALLRDAGARYLWAEEKGAGSFSVDFEEVYRRAADAEYWLHAGSAASIEELLAMDERFGRFKAVQTGNVYDHDRRVNEHGGNAIWERGVLHPEEVLADLVKIFHPERVPDHEFVFYRKLTRERE